MKNNTQDATPVTLDDAVAAIQNWLNVATNAFPDVPNDSLLRAFCIPIDDINDLYNLAQYNGAQYVRAYLSIKDRGNPALTAGLMLVPVDADGNDIIFPPNELNTTNIRDFTTPCPAMCAPLSTAKNGSPLMAPVPNN